MFRNIILFTVVISLFGCAAGGVPSDQIDPSEESPSVDYDVPEIRRVLFPANTTTPLIVLLGNVDGGDGELHSIRFYNEMFSSRIARNAQDYFLDNSNGMWTYSFQGVWGVYDVGELDLTISERFTLAALQLQEEHDLRQYDTNGDGNLTVDELLVVLITDGGNYGGAVRGFNLTMSNGLRVRSAAAILGAQTNLSTAVHEISHLIGTIDLYGSNCNNFNLSLMSCTVFMSDIDNTTHLDPWHKMNLGWVMPRFFDVNGVDEFACYDVEIPQYTGTEARDEQRPVLVFDSNRGFNEYFMIEFRNGGVSQPEFTSYDTHFPRAGVVVWTIRLDDNGYPPSVPSLVKEGGSDRAIWSFGAPVDRIFLSPLAEGGDLDLRTEPLPPLNERESSIWDPSTFELDWQDGTPVGAEVIISDFDDNSRNVYVCLAQK